jgi:hypothetical protein
VREEYSQNIFVGIILLPLVYFMVLLFNKNKILAIVGYWLLVVLLLVALHNFSNHKRDLLYSTNHIIQEDNDPILNQKEFKKNLKLGEIQREFLSSCQLFSNTLVSSIFIFVATIIWLLCKIKYSIPIIFLSPLIIFLFIWFVPWPIEGYWSDGELGCLTSNYHYCEFKNNKIKQYNLCSGIRGDISLSNPMGPKSTDYTWNLKTNKNVQYEFKSTIMRIAATEKSSGKSEYYSVFALRNFDYYTMSRFRDYLENVILNKKSIPIINDI